MKRILISSIFVTFLLILSPASSQSYWVEIDSFSKKETAEEKADSYAYLSEEIKGFKTENGWYLLVLGPYEINQAQEKIQKLQSNKKISLQTNVIGGSKFASQFWPNKSLKVQKNLKVSSLKQKPIIKETLNQSIENEKLLKQAEKNYIQLALKDLNLYSMGIDGTFGEGTRKAIGLWQQDNNLPVTNILTTQQIEILLKNYEHRLRNKGYELVTDSNSGLQLLMPTDYVKFDKYIFPFSHYSNNGTAIDASVILISQPGNIETLKDFYNLFKKFEVIPPEARKRINNSYFSIKGHDKGRSVYVYVTLEENYLKGFLFNYPDAQKEELETAIYLARKTIHITNGGLKKSDTPNSEEKRHFYSGIQFRLPKISRTGFFINETGTVITTNSVLNNCYKLTLDKDIELEIKSVDADLVILQPKENIAPLNYLKFSKKFPKIESNVFISGFSNGGAFGSPSFSMAKVIDLKGPKDETYIKQLFLDVDDSHRGAAMVNKSGAIIGVLINYKEEGFNIPSDIAFSIKNSIIKKTLKKQGISFYLETEEQEKTNEVLTQLGRESSVLVSCW
ncbi:MAG: peptidoglycan-binding protein [Paracoccaceae bacterium]